jgi:hypothetical protein
MVGKKCKLCIMTVIEEMKHAMTIKIALGLVFFGCLKLLYRNTGTQNELSVCVLI